jgi:hypothetical protein
VRFKESLLGDSPDTDMLRDLLGDQRMLGRPSGGGPLAAAFDGYFSTRLLADQTTNINAGDHIEFNRLAGEAATVNAGLITVAEAGTYLAVGTLGAEINEGSVTMSLRDNSDDSDIQDVCGAVVRWRTFDNFNTDATEVDYSAGIVTLSAAQVIKVDIVSETNLLTWYADRCTFNLFHVGNYFSAGLSATQTTDVNSVGDIIKFDISGGAGNHATLGSNVVTIQDTGRYYVSFQAGITLAGGLCRFELRDTGGSPVLDSAGVACRITCCDNANTSVTEANGHASIFDFTAGDELQVEIVEKNATITEFSGDLARMSIVRLS